ncbi:hypothetical protein F5X97DRAFT_328002 [Nemania serpens]|nr:hypothetical protein F5X97DRAFT_328002 [Nemania serpens]
MMISRTSASLVVAALLAGHAAAKTDISGCVSSQTVAYGGASLIWYVPGTGEICEFLDCGGGRAPPKTTVPGCPAYDGTATYSPSYLAGFGASATSSGSSAEATLTGSSSSGSASMSSSEKASITSPPVTKQTSTATTSTSEGIQTDSSSDVASSSSSSSPSSSSSSSAAGGNVTSSSTSSVSTGGAALPTAALKGAIGAVAGLAAGVAML